MNNAKTLTGEDLYKAYIEAQRNGSLKKKDMGAVLFEFSGTNDAPYIMIGQPGGDIYTMEIYEDINNTAEHMGAVVDICDNQVQVTTDYADIDNKGKLEKIILDFGKNLGYDEVRWFDACDSLEAWVGPKKNVTFDAYNAESSPIEDEVIESLMKLLEMKNIKQVNSLIFFHDNHATHLHINPKDAEDQSTWNDALGVERFYNNNEFYFCSDDDYGEDMKVDAFWYRIAVMLESNFPKHKSVQAASDFKAWVAYADSHIRDDLKIKAQKLIDEPLDSFIEKFTILPNPRERL